MIAYVPLIVLAVGLLVWALSKHPIVSEVGRWMFVVGLFWMVGSLSTATIRLMR